MKIIKPGNLAFTVVPFTCKKCECEFEANSKEYFTHHVFGVDGFHNVAYCACPVCDTQCATVVTE